MLCFQQLENKLSYMRFVGCIEDVKFDGLPIGMWDFVNGENNNRGCLGRFVAVDFYCALTTVTSLVLRRDPYSPG